MHLNWETFLTCSLESDKIALLQEPVGISRWCCFLHYSEFMLVLLAFRRVCITIPSGNFKVHSWISMYIGILKGLKITRDVLGSS